MKPCGGSSAAEVLLRVSKITGDESQERVAAAMLGLVRDQMQSHPLASGNWLRALDLHLSDLEEIVVVGRRDDQNMHQLLIAIHGQYRPNKVVAGFRHGDAALGWTLALVGGIVAAVGVVLIWVRSRMKDDKG